MTTSSSPSESLQVGFSLAVVLGEAPSPWFWHDSEDHPFRDFKPEKISIDYGPWMKLFCRPIPRQVRIRSARGSKATRTFFQVMKSCARTIERVAGKDKRLPDLLFWRIVGLRQKKNKKATFDCMFNVQGRTRIVSSHEEDVQGVLAELLSTGTTMFHGNAMETQYGVPGERFRAPSTLSQWTNIISTRQHDDQHLAEDSTPSRSPRGDIKLPTRSPFDPFVLSAYAGEPRGTGAPSQSREEEPLDENLSIAIRSLISGWYLGRL